MDAIQQELVAVPLTQYLKEGTDERHKKAESLNPANSLMQGRGSNEDVIKLFVCNHLAYSCGIDFILKNETEFSKSFKGFTFFSIPSLLEVELDHFNIDQPKIEKLNLLLPNSKFSELGVFYVLQGSMLGTLLLGRKINRFFGKELQIFKKIDNETVLSEWKKYKIYTDALTLSKVERDMALIAARETFNLFIRLYQNMAQVPIEKLQYGFT